MALSIAQRQITVMFDADKKLVSFGGSDFNNGQIDLPADLGLITFELVTPPPGVIFPAAPVQFVNTTRLRPINPPRGATVHRLDGANAALLIVSSQVVSPERLSFYVLVQTVEGEFFGTDPTIVTMPPGT
jgi:hypothetical protein